MKSVYIVAGNFAYTALFQKMGFEVVDKLDESVSLVCFTGGEDVTPAFYGDAQHISTFNNIGRDNRERDIFDNAQQMGIPCVGICRGAQFLNVMNGGRMYQHVTKHANAEGHMMTDVQSGEQIWVSSTHHQMMMPAEHGELIAYATLGGTREWFDGFVEKRDVSNTDYEVLLYPNTRSLCFQPHPEIGGEYFHDMRVYFARLVANLMEQA